MYLGLKQAKCDIINSFGSGDHPWADLYNEKNFSPYYIKELLALAMKDTQESLKRLELKLALISCLELEIEKEITINKEK